MKELNNFRKFLTEEEADKQIHEGTWSLGSVAEMAKALGKLNQTRRMGAARGGVELENMDTMLYNVFGDDTFSDAIDSAKGTDDDDRFNNFMIDAQARAKELYMDELEYRKERGELEENDGVLDEIIGEEKEEVTEATIFDRIDQMMGTIADQMSPDDAFKALAAEFQVVSGGTMMLERALRRMIEDLGLTGDVREEEVEEIRSAYNEEKEEK